MFFNNKFKFNPFHQTAIFSFEDYLRTIYIPLPNVQYLKYELESTVVEEFPIYKLLKGEKGSGKTSALYYLMDSLLKLNNPDVVIFDFKTLELFNGIFTFIQILEDKILGKSGIIKHSVNVEEMRKNMEEGFGNKKIYIFIDVPETREKRIFESFVKTLLYIVGCKNIRIIMAMNNGVYDKLHSFTDLIGRSGKIEAKEIEFFNREQTGVLIKSRLKKSIINNSNKDNLFPFKEGVVDVVYDYSNGIPRNIITACSSLFRIADSEGKKYISAKFSSEILKYNYIDGILKDRISDPTTRTLLKEMIHTIKSNGGIIKSISSLKEDMKKTYGVSPVTVEKRLDLLRKIGLVDVRKGRDNWSKVVKLIGHW